jgi:hypothetical protein
VGVGDGQVGSFPHATRVRLKLETNGSLDSLTSLAVATSSSQPKMVMLKFGQVVRRFYTHASRKPLDLDKAFIVCPLCLRS